MLAIMHSVVYVQTNLGPLSYVHMLHGLACILPFMKSMQSLFKFSQWGGIFISEFIAIVKVCQGWLYNLYYDAILSFQGDEFWSFHGLLKGDHQQIHTKWVTDYNIKCIEHLAFVINGEKIWVHWGVLCLNTNVMLPMTQVAFAIMV